MNNTIEFLKAVKKIISDYFLYDLGYLNIDRIALSFVEGDQCQGLDESENKDRYFNLLKECITKHCPNAFIVFENENSLKAISKDIYKKAEKIFY